MTFLKKIDVRNPVLVCGPMKFLLKKRVRRNRNVLVIYAKNTHNLIPSLMKATI